MIMFIVPVDGDDRSLLAVAGNAVGPETVGHVDWTFVASLK
jgi:hypothetical protein